MDISQEKKEQLDKSFYRQEKVINYSPKFKMNPITKMLDIIDYVDDNFERQVNKDMSFKDSVQRFGLNATLNDFDTTGKNPNFVDTTLYSGDINKEWAKAKKCDEQRDALNEHIQELETKERILKQELQKQEKENLENGKQE